MPPTWKALLIAFTFTPLLLPASVALGETSSADLGEEQILFQEIPSVYGASKYEQKITEAPSSVSIVTADEIKKYGYRTLADILRSVRSFFVTYDRNYSYVGVRGFGRPGDYNTRILVLVNGHRINDDIYDGALIGTEAFIDVDLIDRVEIIRGPGSSLYGTNAFFGVVNVITRQGRSLQGLEISSEAASFDTYKGRLSYGNKLRNGLEVLLSGSLYDSGGQRDLYFGEFDSPATNNGVAQNNDHDHYGSFFAKLSFHDLTLHGGYSSRTKTIPTASFDTVFNDPRNRTTDARGYVELRYDHNFDDQLGVMTRVYYDTAYYNGNYVFDYALPGDPPDLVVNHDYSKGEWAGGELMLTKKLLTRHKLTLGGEYKDDLLQKQGNYDIVTYLDDARRSTNWALYFQGEFTILSNLVFSAGVRHDHYQTFGNTTNPRLALIYNPVEKTTLKFIYGTAFRAPSAYELYYHDNGTQKANPDLQPETITTYNAVLEQEMGDHLRGIVSAYYDKISKLINLQTDPADNLLVFQNVEGVIGKGIEFELDGKWARDLNGRVSYAYQRTEDASTGEVLSNSPRHMAKLNLIAPLIVEKLFSGLELQYMSRRRTLASNHAAEFLVANLTLFSRNLYKGLEVSVSAYNLFNKKYGDPGSEEHKEDVIVQDGRIFRLKLVYGF